ncbi:hypothetical protein [Actinomycetospora soli]|uniref:hypothetical protein n=1 Tax=Actinomycetospora soli TaxID=2893887 RepID=UPI001E566C56|nr:hypothetical protein [Actinomycetospora soli]MCD2186177.1 hypothetical protein [Actinomycetospora soli]
MYLTIADDGVTLHDPERVNDFYASYRQRLTPARLHEVMVEHAGGELLPDGNHVMVPVETLRRLAAGQVDEGWDHKFAGMLSYAQDKGWMSEDGTAVRAHLEREM